MIDSLHGEVLHVGLNHVVIECAGVGYRATAAPSLLGTLRKGEDARILVTMNVRDDGIEFYAFDSDEARQMFAMLRKVSGVGPTSAMAICSVHNPADFARIITNEDDDALKAVKGIGKRTAERIIVDLKSKVAVFDSGDSASAPLPGVDGQSEADTQDDVVGTVTQALVELGFPEKQAERTAQSAATDGGSVSEILKRALRSMSSERN